MLQAERSRVRFTIKYLHFLFFSIYAIFLVALGPGAYSVSNRNEYQKEKKMFMGNKARPVHETDNLTAIWEPIV
jgi:hypothetical protein